MRSPFTGGKATLIEEKATTNYRGDVFYYTRYYYRCNDTGMIFTDAECDEKGLDDIYNQYRKKYGIPSPDQIRDIRKKYNLSAIIMSKILGIGDNQYGLYENGEMPTKSIGRMIATIEDKNVFIKYIDLARGQFSEKEYEMIEKKVENSTANVSYLLFDDNYFAPWKFNIPSFNKMYITSNKSRWRKVVEQPVLALS